VYYLYDKSLRAIEREVEKLNQHLPKKTKSLVEIIDSNDLTLETRDGGKIVIEKHELVTLSKLVPKEYWAEFKLPITLVRRIEQGRGAFTIAGGKIQEFVVAKVLGLTELSFSELQQFSTPLYIYRPNAAQLKMKLRTSTIIAIGQINQ
jgi:uncharacterized protein (UPF0216 family)